MTEDPLTISPDATVAEAAQIIARHKHNRLPVVEHGRLIGWSRGSTCSTR